MNATSSRIHPASAINSHLDASGNEAYYARIVETLQCNNESMDQPRAAIFPKMSLANRVALTYHGYGNRQGLFTTFTAVTVISAAIYNL